MSAQAECAETVSGPESASGSESAFSAESSPESASTKPTSGPEPATPQRRPAILAVDDEPAVLAAVARDLRRGFGERFRILRARVRA